MEDGMRTVYKLCHTLPAVELRALLSTEVVNFTLLDYSLILGLFFSGFGMIGASGSQSSLAAEIGTKLRPCDSLAQLYDQLQIPPLFQRLAQSTSMPDRGCFGCHGSPTFVSAEFGDPACAADSRVRYTPLRCTNEPR